MANIKSSAKRARQNLTRRTSNRYYSSTARTYIKKARLQLEAKEVDSAAETVQLAIQALDKAAKKGIIHANNAARRKSRLVKALNRVKAAA